MAYAVGKQANFTVDKYSLMKTDIFFTSGEGSLTQEKIFLVVRFDSSETVYIYFYCAFNSHRNYYIETIDRNGNPLTISCHFRNDFPIPMQVSYLLWSTIIKCEQS